MKRYIKSSEHGEMINMKKAIKHRTVLKTLEIVIYLEPICERSYPIAASIEPLKLPNGSIDKVAKAEFDDFVASIRAYLYAVGFEDLEKSYTSTKSGISEYFTMYRKSSFTGNIIKSISYIRVSDHGLDSDRERSQGIWFDNHTKSLNEDLADIPMHISGWRPRYITINGDSGYDNYDDALLDIQKRINSWK